MRATLYILGGRSVGRSFVVEDSAIIGREASCQIRLGDKSISRRHARIMWDGFRWRVEDLDSRNGVHLDKQRVREANLADRDEFLLGEVPVRLRIEEEELALKAQEIEFEDAEAGELPAKPVPQAQQTVAPDAPALEEEIELGDEIVLEEEIELGAETAPQESGGLQLGSRAAGTSAAGKPAGPIKLQEAPASRLQKDLDPRAKLTGAGSKRGFLGGDLSQQPTWVLVLLFLVLIIIMAGLTYLVFGVAQSL